MLDKICSVCGSTEQVTIETVTNVYPKRDEMFPVMLCVQHKGMLARGELDIRMDDSGDLTFVMKKHK